MNSLLIDKFKEQFHLPPAFLVHAPGRVNLIGEHTDYNEGFVLPMAIDRAVWIALRPRSDRQVVLHSVEYRETTRFLLNSLQKGKGWAEYIKGAAWAIQKGGWSPSGWDGVMTGDVPSGAGLSSSSAVTMAAILAFSAATNLEPDPVKAALLGHIAEDGWIGVHGGIMDQMVSMLARPGHALFLDCRTMHYEHLPLPAGTAVAVLDTSTRRGLVDSAYNERRHQCDKAAKALGARSLRDVDEASLQAGCAILDDVTRRRARHVITENDRVLRAVEAMRRSEAATLGHLLDASHASLRDDFEVSSKALNTIVDAARSQPGCYGARLTGAGFAGCAIALVDHDKGSGFAVGVASEYERVTGMKPSIYLTRAAGGAEIARLTI